MSSFRSKIQGAGIALIVFLISAVFVLEFGGPQSQGCTPDADGNLAAEVYGQPISTGELDAAYILSDGNRYRPEVARRLKIKEQVLQGLIERNLLAREASELGFHVEEDEVMKRLVSDGSVYISAAIAAPPSMPRGERRISLTDEDGAFDVEAARRYIRNGLGRTVQEFADFQVQETLAQRMRETIAAGVQVSPTEVWDAFVREREQVTIRYVRYATEHYRPADAPDEATMAAWMESNSKYLDEEYEREKHRFTGLEKQVRARHILVKVPSSADDAKKAALRTQAEGLLSQARAPGADFAALATAHSEDKGSAVKGGDLGFNPKGRMVATFDEAQFSLKPGEISDLVQSTYGFHIIKVEAVREGDVPLAEARRELAVARYPNAVAEALASAAATQTLASIAGGETTFAQLDATLEAQREGGEKPSELAPEVRTSQPFGRGDAPVPGSDAGPLVEVAFAATKDEPLPAAPVRGGDGWYIFEMVEHKQATREDFEGDEQQRLSAAILDRKRSEALVKHIQQLTAKASSEGAVRVNPSVAPQGSPDSSQGG